MHIKKTGIPLDRVVLIHPDQKLPEQPQVMMRRRRYKVTKTSHCMRVVLKRPHVPHIRRGRNQTWRSWRKSSISGRKNRATSPHEALLWKQHLSSSYELYACPLFTRQIYSFILFCQRDKNMPTNDNVLIFKSICKRSLPSLKSFCNTNAHGRVAGVPGIETVQLQYHWPWLPEEFK